MLTDLRSPVARLCFTLFVGWRAATGVAQAPDFDFELVHRARFAAVDPQFRPDYPATDQALSLRTAVRLDAVWHRLRLTGELMDARSELNDIDGPLSAGSINALEIIQAAATWDLLPADAAGASSVRVGWLTKDIGGRRLIARNGFRNTVNAFAGADWIWSGRGGRRVNLFYLHPMQRLPDTIPALYANERQADDISGDTVVSGLEFQSPVFGGSAVGELLLLKSDGPDTRLPDAGFHDLTTLSVRVVRAPTPGAWDFEIEAAYQQGQVRPGGESGALDSRAEFLHLSAGYTFGGRASSRIVAQYDYASGDKDPFDHRSERFDTLFGARSFELGPSGIYGAFVRSNLETLGVRATLSARSRAMLTFVYRGFWLASAKDGWLAAELRDETGASGDFIGRQFQAAWAIELVPDRFSVELGLLHLRYGRFALTAPAATGRTHSAYAYAQLTYRLGRNQPL